MSNYYSNHYTLFKNSNGSPSEDALGRVGSPSSPPYIAEVRTSAIFFTTEILFVVEKSAANRIFCFHGILGNLGNLDTSCHVLSHATFHGGHP